MTQWLNRESHFHRYSIILLLALMTCPMQAHAMSVYLSLCSGQQTDPSKLEYLHLPDQDKLWLNIASTKPIAKPTCHFLKLPVAENQIQWARLISDQQATDLQNGIMLSGPNPDLPNNRAELIPLLETAKAHPLRITGEHPPANPAVIQQKTLSTWLWRPEIWLHSEFNGLWSQLKDASIRQVFITIPLNSTGQFPAEPEALKAFIRRADKEHVKVWAVEGDPEFILGQGRAQVIQRAKAFWAYNQTVADPEKLAGVQYDIEPYLIPGFDLNPAEGYQAYLDTIQALKKAQQMPLDLVIPFWLADAEEGTVLNRLTPWVDRVTVMDYRTDPAQIEKLAEPILNWGEQTGKSIQIALEAGELPDETRFAYRPAKTGELWHVQINHQHVLILLDTPATNPHGQSFAFTHKMPAPSNTITFAGNRRALINILPELQTYFARWPSYEGLALHQYLEISKTAP